MCFFSFFEKKKALTAANKYLKIAKKNRHKIKFDQKGTRVINSALLLKVYIAKANERPAT